MRKLDDQAEPRDATIGDRTRGAATLPGRDPATQSGTRDTRDTSSEDAAASAAATLAVDDTLAGSEIGTSRSTVSVSQFPVARWDRYEFLKLLGQGGMGAVYKARDRRLGRTVALKFIRGGDAQLTQRFLQEARAQARIDHPGICKVYEVGEVEGKAYIAMQFVDGLSLQHAAHSMSLLDKVRIIRDAALALHAAHELGIIHRDIKPAKVVAVEKHRIAVRTPLLRCGQSSRK